MAPTSPTKFRYIYLAYLVFLGILAVIYFDRNQVFSIDDSYITYRYAFHLTQGYGLVFNVGEHYYGTTAAGYAVFLALLSLCGQSIQGLLGVNTDALSHIPTLGVMVSTISLLGICMLFPFLSKAGSNTRLWSLCIFSALFIFTAYAFNRVAGHETYPYLALCFIGSVLVLNYSRFILGGFVLALAVTFRPDAVLFAGIIPLIGWLRSGSDFKAYIASSDFLKFTLPYVLVGLPWMIYLFSQFGTILPGTMAAKKAQVALGYWPEYSFRVLSDYLVSSTGIIGCIALFAGIVALVYFDKKFSVKSHIQQLRSQTWRAVKPLTIAICESIASSSWIAACWLVFALVSSTVYILLNVTFWHWYGTPILFSVFIAAFMGWVTLEKYWDVFTSNGPDGFFRLKVAIPTALLTAIMVGGYNHIPSWAETEHVNQHIYAYTEIADHIREVSPNGATLQMMEPGSLGFNLGPDFFIADELGLISPGVAQALMREDYSWTLNKWNPDFLVCSWQARYSSCEYIEEIDSYTYVGEFNKGFWEKHIGRGAKLYQRNN